MNFLNKRIFIIFSVALNIGFVIMAITMAYHHSKPFHERSWYELVDLVQHLKLPESQESAALDAIKQFRVILDKHKQDAKQARRNIFLMFARTGPVDEGKLHQLIEAADNQEKMKNQAFEAHLLELRNLLGDEKRTQFFSLLLEHLTAEDKSPSR